MPTIVPQFLVGVFGFIVLCLPGITVSLWLPVKEHDTFEQLADILGLSIALSALFGLFAFLTNWHISGTWLVVIYVSLGLLAIGGAIRQREISRQSSPVLVNQKNTQSVRRLLFPSIFLAILMVAILAWRFYQIRSLVLPAWVDSLHHVLITKVIERNGGIPHTLEPELPIPFYYHCAFHLMAALFASLTRFLPHQSVLWLGQIFNAAIALSVYRLAQSLWGDWRRSAASAALVGFVSQMPAYYVSWGRYTLLTGLLMLPLAMAAALDVIERKNWKVNTLRLALLTYGVFLSHYFAALLLMVFLVILGFKVVLLDRKQKISPSWNRVILLGIGVLGGFLVSSPWLIRIWRYAGSEINLSPVLSSQSVASVYFPEYADYLWRMLGPQRNYLLVSLAILGIVVGWIWGTRRELMVWSILLGFFSLPLGIRISPFRPDHAVIVLFLPVTLLASDFFFTSEVLLKRSRLAKITNSLLGVALTAIFVWGLVDTHSIVNPSTILATSEDIEAMEWITQNIPAEARFFINVAHWQYGTYRGVDGGWWIPILTERWALLPPVLYATGSKQYIRSVNALAEKASQIHTCSEEFWKLISREGITHIYLVEGRGSLQPSALQSCNGIEMIYAKGNVYIYRVVK